MLVDDLERNQFGLVHVGCTNYKKMLIYVVFVIKRSTSEQRYILLFIHVAFCCFTFGQGEER